MFHQEEGRFNQLPQEDVMVYTRRNATEEQQEACQKAQQLTEIYEQFQITLDPIEWEELGMWAPVKVDGIEIASLRDLWQREKSDMLRQVQIKLLEHAALKASRSRSGVKAMIWSPVEVVQPQAFLSLWIITLETDERIPIVEFLKNERRVYEVYQFTKENRHQLTELFGPAYEGEYQLGEMVTVKVRDHHYTGEIIHIIPPGKTLPGRKYASRGYHTISGIAFTNDVASRYVIDCSDGFPHIAYQSQIIR